MKFTRVLEEAWNQPDDWKNVPEMNFSLKKSLKGRPRNRDMELLFNFGYYPKVNGIPQTTIRYAPVFLSDGWHVMDRSANRAQLDDAVLESFLRKTMQKLHSEFKLTPNGYLAESKRLGIIVPLFLFKNTDPGSDVTKFAEVKTVLLNSWDSAKQFTIFSNKDTHIRTYLPDARNVVVESLEYLKDIPLYFVEID